MALKANLVNTIDDEEERRRREAAKKQQLSKANATQMTRAEKNKVMDSGTVVAMTKNGVITTDSSKKTAQNYISNVKAAQQQAAKQPVTKPAQTAPEKKDLSPAGPKTAKDYVSQKGAGIVNLKLGGTPERDYSSELPKRDELKAQTQLKNSIIGNTIDAFKRQDAAVKEDVNLGNREDVKRQTLGENNLIDSFKRFAEGGTPRETARDRLINERGEKIAEVASGNAAPARSGDGLTPWQRQRNEFSQTVADSYGYIDEALKGGLYDSPIDNQMASMIGEFINAPGMVASQIGRAVGAAVKGGEDAPEWRRQLGFAIENAYLDSDAYERQANIEKQRAFAKEQDGTLIGGIALDLASGINSMLVASAYGNLLGVGTSTLFGIQGGAEKTNQLLDEGRNPLVAIGVGIAWGKVTKAIEGASSFGKVQGGIVEQATKKIGDKAVKLAGQFVDGKTVASVVNLAKGPIAKRILSGMGEGNEELAEYCIEYVFDSLLGREDVSFDIKEGLYSWLIGALCGEIFEFKDLPGLPAEIAYSFSEEGRAARAAEVKEYLDGIDPRILSSAKTGNLDAVEAVMKNVTPEKAETDFLKNKETSDDAIKTGSGKSQVAGAPFEVSADSISENSVESNPYEEKTENGGIDVLGKLLGVESGAPVETGESFEKWASSRKPTIDEWISAQSDEVIKTHTPEQLQTMYEYDNSVDEDVLNYIEFAKDNPNSFWIKQNVGEVTPRAVGDIKKETGIDTTGFTHLMDSDFVSHVEKRHGKNGAADKSMADDNDLARIKYVLENYDTINASNKNIYKFKNSDGSYAKAVVYQKAINGTYYIVEAVPDAKAKTLNLVSAYISTKKEIPSVRETDAKYPGQTSETNPRADETSNNSISENGGESKPYGEKTIKGGAEAISAEIVDSAKRLAQRVKEAKTEASTEMSTSTETSTAPKAEPQTVTPEQSRRSADFERRYESELEDRIAAIFGANKKDLKGNVRPVIESIAADLKAGKEVSAEQIDSLYKNAFADGVITQEFPQYEFLRKYIKETSLYVSKEDRAEFGDNFEFRDFARRNFGSIKIVSDPTAQHIDEFYSELSGVAPEWFPKGETDPKTQLEAVSDFMDQTKRQYYGLSEVYSGENLKDFEAWAKKELKASLDDFGSGMSNVIRYERDRQIKATNKAREMDPKVSFDAAKAAFADGKVYKAQKDLERAKAKNLLSDADRNIVKSLLAGTMTEGDVELQNLAGAGINFGGIIKVYRAEKAYREARAPFDAYRKAYRESVTHDAISATSDSDNWTDKAIGAFYSRETAERNIMDITKNGAFGGKKIIEEYFTPVHEHEALKTKWINGLNDRVRRLELGHMNKYERAYAQMIGENYIYLTEGRLTKHDQAEHDALNSKIEALLKEHGGKINKENCEKAAAGFLEIYKDIHEQWNDERIRRGQEPVGNIEGYFPHFQERKAETVLQKIFSVLGFDISSSKLPTDIAGRTADRKPQTKYNPHAKERTSDLTDYDIFKGFDSYVRAVGDNIYHTEDIQKLRALSDTIRVKYSSENLEKRIEEIRNREDISAEDKETLIANAFSEGQDKYHLSNLVTWIDEYTNILAGKKSRGDREAEYQMGREIYDVSKALEGRIAANMVGYNASTPIMNLVPLFQATADIAPQRLVFALAKTGVAALKGDSYISDNSDFITNRLGTDSIYKENYNIFQSENMKDAVSKIQDGGAVAMEFVDRIVSDALVRARVEQNLKKGLGKEEAFSEADRWAAGLMADRSLGAMPTVFNVKNPVAKAFTMFQVEVNNQFSYIAKDAGKYKWDDNKLGTLFGQVAFWLSAALCNWLGDEFLGRDNIVPDPIGITYDSVNKIQNGEAVGDVVLDAATNAVEQLPFVGGILGGGRVPISSALPEAEQVVKFFNRDVSAEKKRQILLDEVTKPLSLLLLPSGSNQLWKTGKGAAQLIEGGAYGTDNDGNKYMKFPQEYDPASVIRTLLFGQYSSERGQEYIDSGFKRLSADETAAMEKAENFGIPKNEFYDLVLGLKEYKKDAEKREALLANDNFTAKEKYILNSLILEGNGTKPQYILDRAIFNPGLEKDTREALNAGITKDRFYEEIIGLKNYGSQEKKQEALFGESGLDAYQKGVIDRILIGGEKTRDYTDAESFRWSGLTAKQQSYEKNGVSEELAKTIEDIKKEQKGAANIQAAIKAETGCSDIEAYRLYKISENNWLTTVEDLDEDDKKRLESAKAAYGIDDDMYVLVKNWSNSGESEKDEYDNSISGTAKEDAIINIMAAGGLDYETAKRYYTIVNSCHYDRDGVSSAALKDFDDLEQNYGWTEEECFRAYNALKFIDSEKKEDMIAAIKEAGFTTQEATGYYNLYKNNDYYKKSGPTTYAYGMSNQKHVDKAGYFLANYNSDGSVTSKDISAWYKAAAGCKKKAEYIAAYQSAGATYQQALTFYNLMKGNDKSFNAWYKENGGD